MQISEHFSLKELTVTNTGLVNIPISKDIIRLIMLCNMCLEPIRAKFGPLLPTSGYRSYDVNSKVGGEKTSQHVLGEAVDFIPLRLEGDSLTVRLDKIFKWIVEDSGIMFGQCIRETKDNKNWIHVSLQRVNHMNQDAKMYDGTNYVTYRR